MLQANGVIGKERKSGEPFCLEEAKEEKPEPEPVKSNLILDGAEIKPKYTVVDRIPTGYTVNLSAQFRFDTLDDIYEFFHSDTMLSALIDNVDICEENSIVFEGLI